MAITAAMVKELREKSGAGMMDAKKALTENNGDLDQAMDWLRTKGLAKAAKKSGRTAAEGLVAVAVVDGRGVAVEVNSETDFVGKNADFIELAHKIANTALSCKSKEELLKASLGEMTVEEKLIEQTGVIGEKIQINDFARIDAEYVGTYIHAGNKISSLVGFSEKADNIEVAGKDIAMQIAAMNPIALDEKNVDAEVIEKEIEIAKDQLRQEGKPEEMLENIAKGKLKKFFKENTLINQQFIKDSKLSISQYLKSYSDSVEVTDFSRVGLV